MAALVGTLSNCGNARAAVFVGNNCVVCATADDASGSGGALQLRSLDPDSLAAPLATFTSPARVHCVAHLEGSVVVSGSSDSKVRLWNLGNPEAGAIRVFLGHVRAVQCLASVGPSRFVSGSQDCTLRLWHQSTPSPQGVFEGHTGTVTDVVCIDEHRIVSASDDRTLRVWLINTQTCTSVLEGHTERVWTLCNLGGGKIASGSADTTLRLWDLATNACVSATTVSTAALMKLSLITHKWLAVLTGMRTVGIWNLETQTPTRHAEFPTDHAGLVWNMTTLPGGVILTVADDRTLRMFDANIRVGPRDLLLRMHCEPHNSALLQPLLKLLGQPAGLTVEDLTTCVQLNEAGIRERWPSIHKCDVLRTWLLERFPALDTQTAPLLQAQQETIAQLRRDLEQSVARVQDLEGKLAEHESVTKNLQDSAVSRDSEIGRLQHELDSCNDRLDAALAEVAANEESTRPKNYRRVGNGAFGTVFKANVSTSLFRRDVAVKRIRFGAAVNATKLAAEVQLLATLEHPCIIKTFDAFTVQHMDPDAKTPEVDLHIVMEFCAGGSLADLSGVPQRPVMHEVARQTTRGLAYLHGRTPAVQHLDIKPANICLLAPLTSDPFDVQIKFVDFGMADEVVATISSSRPGTTSFWSPERFAGERYNLADDVWAVGLTLLFVATGLASDASVQAEYNIAAGGATRGSFASAAYQPRLDQLFHTCRANHGEVFQGVLTRMLDTDRSGRITALDAARQLAGNLL